MRIAIIDTGTNTFHLLIVDLLIDGTFKKIFKSKEAVKLGEGGIASRKITDASFNRGLKTFEKFRTICRIHQPEKTFAFGTAALRRAENAGEFIDAVKQKFDFEIKIISGDEEAELIWKGVRHALPLSDENVLIMDIGGGSTEFIIANNNQIFWKQSFELGAALLLDIFHPNDPITQNEINLIEQHLEKSLLPLFEMHQQLNPKILIGSSGSFDTFADVITYAKGNHDVLLNATTYNFDIGEFNQVHSKFLTSTHAERLQTKGMLPMRADMIVIAGILTNFVLCKLCLKEMKLSTYALKEGVLFGMLKS